MDQGRIDLAALDTRAGANEGRELEVLHLKTREPIGLRITLLGTDSDAYERAVAEQQRATQDRLVDGQRKRLTVREIDDNAIELLVALTRGWSAFDLDGKDFPYSSANARALYRRFPWIREQADAFAGARANFLPRSAAS